MAVRLPRFVMSQDVALSLLIKHVNVVVCQVDDSRPQAPSINHHRGGCIFRAAHDQHHHQTYG